MSGEGIGLIVAIRLIGSLAAGVIDAYRGQRAIERDTPYSWLFPDD